MFNKINILCVIFGVALIAGCKEVPLLPGISAHRIDIQQGNAVTQEMVSKLQSGMTRAQVRFVLGTPLIIDPFHSDRWDYVYTYKQRGELIEQRRLIVFFKDDKLDRVEGDVIPAKPKPEVTAAEKPKPAAAKPEIAKPETAKPVETAPSQTTAPSTLTTTDGKPVGTGETAPVAKPAAEAQKTEQPAAVKPEDKPAEERGFFGRMLEKIGL